MSVPVPQRVLVVGSGSIAQRHVRNLLALGVAEVLVVTARDTSDVESFADARVRVVPAIPDDHPGLAVVANATDRHLATARQLAALGVHFLLEKPVASEYSDELVQLCSEVRAAGLVGLVAYNLRLLGALGRIRETVESGSLGRPLFARIEVGQWLPDWRPQRPVETLYSASAERGGGVALDLSHEVDYMTTLFGHPQRWHVETARTGALPIESADVFDGVYSFAEGFTCTVHLDYLERRPRRRLRVVCTDGVIECDIIAGVLTVNGPSEKRDLRDPSLFDVQATYIDELKAFFSAVEGVGGPSGLPTLDEGCDVLRLLSDSDSCAATPGGAS